MHGRPPGIIWQENAFPLFRMTRRPHIIRTQSKLRTYCCNQVQYTIPSVHVYQQFCCRRTKQVPDRTHSKQKLAPSESSIAQRVSPLRAATAPRYRACRRVESILSALYTGISHRLTATRGPSIYEAGQCPVGRAHSSSTPRGVFISAFGTQGAREYSAISAFVTPRSREYSVIPAFDTPGTESLKISGTRVLH